MEVITTFPSYPGGKLFPGYKQRWRHFEFRDGVKLVRLPTYVSHGKSTLKRIISYLSFGIGACIYSNFGTKKPNIVYAYYPPVIVGMVALSIQKLRNVPYIYDVQDLWPEALIGTGKIGEGRISRSIEKICKTIYKNAAHVIVLSNGYRRVLVEKGIEAAKISTIFNWCDESRLGVETEAEVPKVDEKCFNIVYAGNLGSAQALQHVVAAAAVINSRGYEHIKFIFVGSGIEEPALKKQAADLLLPNVEFLPQMRVEDIGCFLHKADALLVHLADDPVFEITIPSKLQAYMMIGRPIIMAVKGEGAAIVQSARAGVTLEPCQPEKLAQTALAISRLSTEELNAMGARGKAYYGTNMSMKNGVNSIDAIFRSVLNSELRMDAR